MLRRIVVLSTLAIVSSGCFSLVAVDGPPRLRPGAPLPDHAVCTRSMAAPVVDFALAVGAGVVVVKNRPERHDAIGGAFVRLIGVLGGLGTVSGLIGVHRVQACRDFTETISAAADSTGLQPAWPIDRDVVADRPPPRPQLELRRRR